MHPEERRECESYVSVLLLTNIPTSQVAQVAEGGDALKKDTCQGTQASCGSDAGLGTPVTAQSGGASAP